MLVFVVLYELGVNIGQSATSRNTFKGALEVIDVEKASSAAKLH
jgi:hypothetical protein